MEHTVKSSPKEYLELCRTFNMELLQKTLTALSIFAKKLVLDVLLVSKYASALYPQKYAKIQLLNNFSEILNKFFSFLF